MSKIKITPRLLEAFLKGETTIEESLAVVTSAKRNAQVRMYLRMAQETYLPMANEFVLSLQRFAAMSATNECVIRCEYHILQSFDIPTTFDDVKKLAKERGWLHEEGTPVYEIGRILEAHQLSVARRCDCNLDILAHELETGCQVIAVVDENKLRGENGAASSKANHAIVVTQIEEGLPDDGCRISVYDPQEGLCVYSEEVFMAAWKASSCLLISCIERGKRPYTPHPIDISGVVLPPEAELLSDIIAENVHDQWVANRIKKGWKYGAVRNDEKKEHPDMIAYAELPQVEKEKDLEMALQSLKVLYRLGYVAEKAPNAEPTLPDDILKLIDILAENAHDVWASGWLSQGWQYGYDKAMHQNPFLIPYCELTDPERQEDRDTVSTTLKSLYSAGYQLVKKCSE